MAIRFIFPFRRTIKTAAILSGFALLSHIYALGVREIETRIADSVSTAYAETVEELARASGFERKGPAPALLSPMDIAEREALRRGINPAVVRALIRHESGGNQYAVSSASALGLMQVMPANARRCGLQVAELLDAEKNIMCGVKILSEDLKATGGYLPDALRRYNGGPKCVSGRCRESENHQRQVLALLTRDLRG